MKNLVAVIFTTLFLTSYVFADSFEEGLKAAVQDQKSVITEFNQLDLNSKTQAALNNIIAAANAALAERGYTELAENYQMEWDSNYSSYFTGITLMDLGDHKPLSQWLAGYYKKTEDVLGDPVMKVLHFDDLYAINYGLPVVMHPAGDPSGHDHWNQLEYQRHFVPFSAAVSFWGSLIACQAVAINVAPMKRWCGLIAMIVRGVMKSTIAPKLSDTIYVKSRGGKKKLELDYTQIEEYYNKEALKIPRQD